MNDKKRKERWAYKLIRKDLFRIDLFLSLWMLLEYIEASAALKTSIYQLL